MRNPILRMAALQAALGMMDMPSAFPNIPTRLDINDTPREVCARYDIYLDGVKQSACKMVDTQQGVILRFKRSVGHKPVANKHGKYETEMLRGKVEIRLKGAKGVTGTEIASVEVGESERRGLAIGEQALKGIHS